MAESSAAASGTFPIPQRTILVVDDEALIRWSLGESLRDAGYRVLEAEDARAALEAFSHRVDLALVDFKLPGIDGLELLSQLKGANPRCPAILMTAHGSDETTAEARRRGAECVVAKPFVVDDVVRLLGATLQPS